MGTELLRGFFIHTLLYGLTIIGSRGLVNVLSNVRAINSCRGYLTLCRLQSNLLGVTFIVDVCTYNDFVRGSSENVFRSTTYGQSTLLFATKRYDATFAGCNLRSVERHRSRVVTTNLLDDYVSFFLYNIQFTCTSVIMGNVLRWMRSLRCRTSLLRRLYRERIPGIRTSCCCTTEFCVPGPDRRVNGDELSTTEESSWDDREVFLRNGTSVVRGFFILVDGCGVIGLGF